MSEPGLTTPVYLRAREVSTARRLIDELLGDGIENERIRVHAARRARGLRLPVTRITYRTPPQALIDGAAIGALFASLITVLLLLIGAVELAVLVLVLGAAVGGIFGLLQTQLANREIEPQLDALRRGELVLVLELDHDEIGQVEDRIKARHPEVAVLGGDPAGTPPFP